MDLVDRYLNAVRFWLPKSERQDIIAELGEDIHSQIEERQDELGRDLTEDELEAVLKRCGSPTAVAERYLPQRRLIGPLLLPVYLFVLKLVALVYLVPWLAVWIVLVAFVPSYRAAHPGPELFETLSTWWNTAFYAFGFITAAFAIAERARAKSNSSDAWSPRCLPAVRDAWRISRARSIVEIACCGLFALWWAGALRFPIIVSEANVPWTLSPVWRSFRHDCFGSILALTLAGIALAGFNLARPSWTGLRLGIKASLDAAGMIVLGFFLRSQGSGIKALWVRLLAERQQLPKAELLAGWSDVGVFSTLLIALAILLASAVSGYVRMARRGPSEPPAQA
ncbi:MAG: hypothetical protein ABFD80_12300 [Acidobacteriota bacterium]